MSRLPVLAAALPRNPRNVRAGLVEAANAAEHAYADERAAAVDAGTFTAYLADRDAHAKAAADTAWQAVREFDSEHPEIAAELAEATADQVAQWMDR